MYPLHTTGWPNSWGTRRTITLEAALAELEKEDEVRDIPAIVYCNPQYPRWSPQGWVVETHPETLSPCVGVLKLLEEFVQLPSADGYAFALPDDVNRGAVSARLCSMSVPHRFVFCDPCRGLPGPGCPL